MDGGTFSAKNQDTDALIANNKRWIACFGSFAAALGAGLIGLAGSRVAGAVTDLNPSASVDISHSSNIFQLPGKEQLPPGFSYQDTVTRYIVGGTADFDWGPDKLALNAQGSRVKYTQNGSLNHYESVFGGKFDWFSGPVLSATVDYSQSRTNTPPGNTLSQELLVQTDHIARGTFRFLLTPKWRLDVEPLWHKLDSPLPLYPEFGYNETGVGGALLYTSMARLWSGVRFSYLDGSYHHIVDATRYNQKIVEATSNYSVTRITAFDFRAGYTWRSSSLVNPADADPAVAGNGQFGTTSGFTGSIGLTHRVTIKTGINFKVFREVSSFGAGANSDVSTGVEGGVKWDPDFRFTVDGHYRYARETIEGVQAITGFDGRSDRTNGYGLGVQYHAFKWLNLRSYVERTSRNSNLARAGYNATLVGIIFTVQLHPPLQ